ncbi:MAG: hypothetical protein AB1439_05170 [candidate division FCPU426 bacterium]
MPPLLLTLLSLLWFALLAAGSAGWGRLLLRQTGLQPSDVPAEAGLSLGLGLMLVSYAAFCLASLHLFTPLALGLLTAAAMAGAYWHLRLGCWWLNARPEAAGPWALALLAGLLFLAAANALGALTPAWDWDGVAYHLALPKIYLQAGGFVFRPDIYHNLFPQFTEMLFALGWWSPWGAAAKLVHFGFGLLAAAAVFSLARASRLGQAALLAAAFFYAQYLVHVESGTAFIDLATAAYAALALLSLRQAVSSGQAGWHYLAALFAGTAAATKWHGLLLLACLALWQAAWILKAEANTLRARLRRIAGVLVWGSLPVLPYLVRAWAASGNPVWPLGYSLFGGRFWDADIDRLMTAFVAGFSGHTQGWLGFLLLPWDLLTAAQDFGVGAAQARLPLLGLLAALAGGVWILANRQAKVRWPWPLLGLALGLGFLATWFFSSPQFRYLLPLFPLLAWLAAAICSKLWLAPGRLGKAWAVLAAALILAVHPPLHRDTLEQARTVAGLEAPADFLGRRLDHFSACEYLNHAVKPGERVLLFNENRGFYLDVDYLWGDPLNQNLINYRRLDTAQALRQRLDKLGVRWVLVRRVAEPREDYYSRRIVALMDGCLALGSEQRFASGEVAVYLLSAAAAAGLSMNNNSPAMARSQAAAHK